MPSLRTVLTIGAIIVGAAARLQADHLDVNPVQWERHPKPHLL